MQTYEEFVNMIKELKQLDIYCRESNKQRCSLIYDNIEDLQLDIEIVEQLIQKDFQKYFINSSQRVRESSECILIGKISLPLEITSQIKKNQLILGDLIKELKQHCDQRGQESQITQCYIKIQSYFGVDYVKIQNQEIGNLLLQIE